MNNQVNVTAIVTTYKREPEIVKRAVKSILNQTYRGIKVVVVDDSPASYGLRENVREEVCKLSPNIIYVQHEQNMGACVARNTGLKYADTEYVAYLDDDDEWVETKIEKQIKVFNDSKLGLVYCGNSIKYDTDGRVVSENREFHRGDVFDMLICKNFIGSTSFPLIRTKCIKEVGEFDPLMLSAQDYDLWLRITEKYLVDYVPESLVTYHIHAGEQISANPNKKVQGLERLNEKNMEYLEKNKEAYWFRFAKIIPYYMCNGQEEKAVTTWKRCVRKYPYKIKGNVKYLLLILRKRGKKRS